MSLRLLCFVFALALSWRVSAQPFKFALVSDTHIGSDNAIEDLERTVADLNAQPGLAFVLFSGDITEMGTNEELKIARGLIGKLAIPWYIVPGNHDTGWSESGGAGFIREFGYDKFVFEYQGFKFIGCASGPYVRMSDGHIPRDAVIWMDSILAKTPRSQPLVFVNHYPLDNGLDNWYEITDRLKRFNTQFALCGHGHSNNALDFEGIPGVMGRSNLRAKAAFGGYTLAEVRTDSVLFFERTPGVKTSASWRTVKAGAAVFDTTKIYPRPSFAINTKTPVIAPLWTWHSNANVVSTPAYGKGRVIFGNAGGLVEAISAATGKRVWSFKTGGGIFSSPAMAGNRTVAGSADGYVYCFNSSTGGMLWAQKTGSSVLGSPLIDKKIVYIGGSDHTFRALDLVTGKPLWEYNQLEGPVVSTPLLWKNAVIFGAWDKYLYALDKRTGALMWKWSNCSANRMYSPAMCIPQAVGNVVYIVAPDRFITAIDFVTGKTLWRTKEGGVRESIGLSADKKLVYAKTMNDEIVAYQVRADSAVLAWKLNCGFGYEHAPSMLIERNGAVYFGTRKGEVYSADPKKRKVNWVYKIDNSMVNTVNVTPKNRLLAATMDGQVIFLQIR
ncbi:outer membrane protein assembly factor BamB family protein [Hufsiella ginkgonis]|uniref:PQQ-binding-like beta-propeller repeat protein n=1 Tax=Hufsiella ginkgonis TaxID=2695274 RepID=A0A7K1XZF8_9SPHI|nr:PQQ-binding-like beta-propeller repeat protein [Hufsiella ginkgonis]MXV16332.1 PQQ-binding-like beta-propeller repeat protein [Hufsiella ginkgonis]